MVQGSEISSNLIEHSKASAPFGGRFFRISQPYVIVMNSLLKELKAGNVSAFFTVVRLHWNRLTAKANLEIPDWQRAHELAGQVLFVQLEANFEDATEPLDAFLDEELKKAIEKEKRSHFDSI